MLLPFLYAILGFCFAFIGKTFTKEVNLLPFTQIIRELTEYVRGLIGISQTSEFMKMSFPIHDFLLPGVVYVLSIISFLIACRLLYDEIEVDNLEDSLIRMFFMSIIFFVCVFVYMSGGKILIILTGVLVLLLNCFLVIVSLIVSLLSPNEVKVNS